MGRVGAKCLNKERSNDMPKNMKMYWLHALTPLHVGAGRGVGFIDLPIMREKVTNWPLVPGSAVKGVLADAYGATEEQRKVDRLRKAAFGTISEDSSNSGSLLFTDARLVCLPIRSFFGTFAWVTSSLALQRLKRDLDAVGLEGTIQTLPSLKEQELLLPHGTTSVLKDSASPTVYFEDLDFTSREDAAVGHWADQLARWIFQEETWQSTFKQRFAVIDDGSFDFLTGTGTEVNARVRIDPERKTVAPGALWYEESLPVETILAGLVWCDKVFLKDGPTQAEILHTFCSDTRTLQIGGKATVGKGRVRCLFSQQEA